MKISLPISNRKNAPMPKEHIVILGKGQQIPATAMLQKMTSTSCLIMVI